MAGITYLHTGGVLSRKSGGGHTFKLCTIFPHTLELLFAFRYDWENETILPGTLRHFKRYQTCIVTFCTYYIAWILGDEGRGENGDCSRSVVRTVSTGCETPQCAASWMLLLYARDSSRWLLTPGPHFLSRGAQTFWHRARAYTNKAWKQGPLITTQECSTNNNLLAKSDAACLHLKKNEGICSTHISRRGDQETEKAPNEVKTA